MTESAKDVTPSSEYIKVFLTGDFGTGKSVFASTCPTKGYVFDFDDGIQIYRGLDFDYDNFPLTAAGWVTFEKTLRDIKKAVIEEKKYETVVVDSTSSMTDIAMERALQLDPKRSETNGPIWNVHYMMVRNLMEGKLRQIIALPCNVIVIAHLYIEKDEKTGAIIGIEPLLTGQLSYMVPGYFGEVYCSFSRQVQAKKAGDPPRTVYYIRTVPRGWYKARSRLSGVQRLLPDEIPNSYTALVKAYEKGIIKMKGDE
jgi:hypothetical protein